MRRSVAAGMIAVAAAVTISPAPASAHDYETPYLYVDITDDEMQGNIQLPYRHLRQVFSLSLSDSGESVLSELERNLPALHQYLREHTSIGSADVPWPYSFDGVRLLSDSVRADGSGYAIFDIRVDVLGGTVPQVLEFTFDPFFDEIDDMSSLVLVGNDWARGVFNNESNQLVVLDARTPSAVVDLGEKSQWRNFTGSLKIGVDHIRTGADHIFFILVLLLPSVLVLASGWRPAPSFGSALWRVTKVATMFTLAHSITLSLASLGLLPLPPSRVIEAIIALSITAAALHNLWPILREREWLIAFGFGLFHGMGFASLVQSLDVDRATQLVSLLGRNAGIEIGQTVIILVVFPALFLLRRTLFYRPVLVVGSLGLALLSLIWAFERVFAFSTGATGVVTRIVAWPRSFVAMVAVTLVAGWLYQRERRADRLLDSGATVATPDVLGV